MNSFAPLSSVLLPWITYNVVLTLITLILLYFTSCAIYHLCFSPLRTVPGPWYAAISDLWIMTHVVRLQQCKINHKLLQKYGPVVRVGPNKVIFKDITSIRNIYSVYKFDKSPFYKCFITNENDHAMTTLDHAGHSMRRKGYAPYYIPANLALFQPEIHEHTMELICTLENIGGKYAVDSLALFRHFMVDVLIAVTYGYRKEALQNWIRDVQDPIVTAIADFPKRGIIRSAVPAWVWNLISCIPNSRWQQICDSDRIMAEFVTGCVYETRIRGPMEGFSESGKVSLLSRLLQHKYPNGQMPDEDIISEMMGHMIAGTDTTSSSLSYFCWELSRRRDIMRKLQTELDEAMPNPQVIPDISVLQKLPYLNAFTKEGLRLYSAAPSPLERVVPSVGGKNGVTGGTFNLMGYALPPGTIIATQAWSMHRDPLIFPAPDTFLPERWLQGPEALAKMSQYLMPFGTGSRICGGQNLAQMMLKILIAAIVRNFDIVAAAETDERSMEVRDAFVIFPASMECKLSFHPRNQ